MFNWMNRRLYHAIRIWFKVFGVALICCATVAGLAAFVNWAGTTYGQNYGMLAFLGVLINALILFMSAVHVHMFYEFDESKVREYKKSKNPPLHWRLFKWMNRKVFLFLANYLFVIGMLAICAAAIVIEILMIDWGVANYGQRGGIGVFLGSVFTAISFVIAYNKSEEAVKEERKEQNRIYKSLTRDWDYD